jgi:hypothetical protein
MKLTLVLLLISVCVLTTACGDDDDGGEANQPLADVAAFIQNQPLPNQLEPEGLILREGEHACVIPVKPEPRSVINGTCKWTTEEVEDGWVVTVTETWSCADFNAIQGSSGFCVAETGSHEWVYRVTPEGEVRLFNERGDPAPEGLDESGEAPAPTIAPTP